MSSEFSVLFPKHRSSLRKLANYFWVYYHVVLHLKVSKLLYTKHTIGNKSRDFYNVGNGDTQTYIKGRYNMLVSIQTICQFC